MVKKKFSKDRIRSLRLAHHMTLEAFAEKVGDRIKKQHVSNWELGKSIPDTSSLLNIVNAFEIDMSFFFVDNDCYCSSSLVAKH